MILTKKKRKKNFSLEKIVQKIVVASVLPQVLCKTDEALSLKTNTGICICLLIHKTQQTKMHNADN